MIAYLWNGKCCWVKMILCDVCDLEVVCKFIILCGLKCQKK